IDATIAHTSTNVCTLQTSFYFSLLLYLLSYIWLSWCLQKPGEAPKLLIRSVLTCHYSGTDFTLTISRVQTEDVEVYYCQQSNRGGFGGGPLTSRNAR
uniref:Immunoglobulin V-set domain-containing protein n=1 Tax=Monopterus albus TaxID=43700 RepID=A0A3Q3J6L9_MONAL